MGLVEVLKALGEPMRLRILNLLARDMLCVCDLETVLQLTQSNASRHLSTLRRAGLIVGVKKAQWVYYKLDNDILDVHPFLREFLDQEFDKIKQCQTDRNKLIQYKEKGGGCISYNEKEEAGLK
ncbi:MAG: ArsR/SmtB family transcription factor [Negativicutes bacterium]